MRNDLKHFLNLMLGVPSRKLLIPSFARRIAPLIDLGEIDRLRTAEVATGCFILRFKNTKRPGNSLFLT